MGELYRLDFANGKSYVGITKGKSTFRYKGHRRVAEAGSLCAVHAAWRKHGEPCLTVLAILEDRELPSTEMRAIAAYKTLTPAGYNMTPGGESNPMHTESAKAKVSAKLLGRVFKAETIERMSLSATRRCSTPEGLAAVGLANKGKRASEASRAKMRVAQTGRTHSEETKRKIGKATASRAWSEESRAKMRGNKNGSKRKES